MKAKSLSVLSVLVCLLAGWPAAAQDAGPGSAELLKAVDQLAAGKHDEGIDTLKQLLASDPSEQAFFTLGTAFLNKGSWDRAAATFEDGVAKYPLSARLYNGAGLANERQLLYPAAIGFYRKAVALEPTIAYTGGGRYDPEFDAIYLPVVHDHRGVNFCSGRLYVNGEKMHFVVYHVLSEWGQGNDDSFETPYANVSDVEIDRKAGEQYVDYGLFTLLTNLSGPRRRLSTTEQSRVDLKFIFRKPIAGYRGRPWTKNDIKFFFIEPEVGEQFIKFVERHDIKTFLRKK
jgi:tetratricopeptide (TPR) repeat protein